MAPPTPSPPPRARLTTTDGVMENDRLSYSGQRAGDFYETSEKAKWVTRTVTAFAAYSGVTRRPALSARLCCRYASRLPPPRAHARPPPSSSPPPRPPLTTPSGLRCFSRKPASHGSRRRATVLPGGLASDKGHLLGRPGT